jgi:type VI secretion system protein ImpA
MPLRDDLLSPLPGANPSGVNLRYDPKTEAIKEARREDLDVAQGEWKTALKSADYPQVIKLAGDLLATRGKDLWIAVWLVDAHIRREGFAIIPPSFEFLARLLEQFWDTLYPEIEDGDLELRVAPLDWLGTKLEQPLSFLPITSNGLSFAQCKQSRLVGYEQDATTEEKRQARQQAIKEGKPTAEEFDAAVAGTSREFYENIQESLGSALEKLELLTRLCNEKFGDYSPSFLKTRSMLESIGQQIRIFVSKIAPAPAPPAPVVVVPVANPVAVTVAVTAPVAAAPAPAAAPVSSGVEPSGLEDAVGRIGAICRYLREKTIFDSSAFLTIRAFRWGELRAKAPAIEPAMLQAPSTELRAELKGHFVSSAWDAVLNVTENAMELPCGRAWLDLQRYTVQALEKKGDYYALIGGSIRSALRSLLEELPGLLDQTMTDDTPVANPETRAWIMDAVLSGQPIAAAAIAAPLVPQSIPQPVPQRMDTEAKPPDLEPDEYPAVKDIFDDALAAARSSRPAEAVEIISKQLASERSGRGRFRRRTQLAHLLMVGGLQDIAMPILEQLAAEIDQRHLQDWEHGEALAYPLDLLIRCLDANGSDALNRKQLYARLCQLDPVRALKAIPS